MKNLHAIRRNNLLELLGSSPSKAEFAKICSIAKAQLSTFISPTKTENIGSKIARRIETAHKLPEYWLDYPHDGGLPVISDIDLIKIGHSALSLYTQLAAKNIAIEDLDEGKLDSLILLAAKNMLATDENKAQLTINFSQH